jgi:hypothetical protein
MSITSYAELQTAVQTWLDRADLSANAADFIMLFEANANRRLRVRQMLSVAALTPVDGDAALPADYLEWKRVTWTGSVRRELDYVEPAYLQAAYPAAPTDIPVLFTIEGATLKIRPIDVTPLELLYYQKIPPLSNTNTSNWLLAAHADAYLAGALAEAAIFTENADAAQLWLSRRDAALAEIERLSQASRGQASVRTLSPTP